MEKPFTSTLCQTHVYMHKHLRHQMLVHTYIHIFICKYTLYIHIYCISIWMWMNLHCMHAYIQIHKLPFKLLIAFMCTYICENAPIRVLRKICFTTSMNRIWFPLFDTIGVVYISYMGVFYNVRLKFDLKTYFKHVRLVDCLVSYLQESN